MRILRLTTSDDLLPMAPGQERGYRIVERALAAETGEPVETIVREIWPTADLPDVVGRWLERYEPDIVSLKVSSFWWTYQSVPLKLERSRLGPVGKLTASAGRRAADTAWLAHSRSMIGLRDGIRRLFGGATHFTADEVIERISLCLRRAFQREGVLLVVRGGLVAETLGCTPATQVREEEARRRVDSALAALCAELHVHYTGCRAAPPLSWLLTYRQRDRLHQNALGQQRVGEEEARAMIAAWRHAHGAELPLYLESNAVV
jgi:hypothetical protein